MYEVSNSLHQKKHSGICSSSSGGSSSCCSNFWLYVGVAASKKMYVDCRVYTKIIDVLLLLVSEVLTWLSIQQRNTRPATPTYCTSAVLKWTHSYQWSVKSWLQRRHDYETSWYKNIIKRKTNNGESLLLLCLRRRAICFPVICVSGRCLSDLCHAYVRPIKPILRDTISLYLTGGISAKLGTNIHHIFIGEKSSRG